LLTENVLLAVMGGAAGLLLTLGSLQMARAINPANIPRLEEIGISRGILAIKFGISRVAGILFGVVPA
jgi:hypothetical protein